jgi:hypothetical protein
MKVMPRIYLQNPIGKRNNGSQRLVIYETNNKRVLTKRVKPPSGACAEINRGSVSVLTWRFCTSAFAFPAVIVLNKPLEMEMMDSSVDT